MSISKIKDNKSCGWEAVQIVESLSKNVLSKHSSQQGFIVEDRRIVTIKRQLPYDKTKYYGQDNRFEGKNINKVPRMIHLTSCFKTNEESHQHMPLLFPPLQLKGKKKMLFSVGKWIRRRRRMRRRKRWKEKRIRRILRCNLKEGT